MANIKPTFEESIKEIDALISKRRHKWSLTALAWLDYEDISQILRLHIYKKWDLYDPSFPLANWCQSIISNQIRNLVRNNYGNFSRPCLRCPANEGDNLCSIYEKQCDSCPLYANWQKRKKDAHDTKLPVSLENHSQEVYNIQQDNLDIEKSADNLHKKMQQVLKPIEWRVYKLLYIEHKTEEQVAKTMGYKTTESGRMPGHRQIRNIKKAIFERAKLIVHSGEIDII